MPDQEDISHQRDLLRTYRRTLTHLLGQQATFSAAYTPPHIAHGIDEARAQIRRIKRTLRGWGQAVEDLPDDEPPDPAARQTTAREPQPAAAAPPAEPPGPSIARPGQEADSGAAGRPGYDLFVSYDQSDREWVRRELLPRLESAGLNVIVDYRDFEIGAPKAVNIEQAVDNSRHTLIVMTPDWLASEWDQFASLLTSSADPAARRRKLLPLMLKPCAPPPLIEKLALDIADFTDPAEREMQMKRLLRALSKPAEVAAPRPTAAPGAESATRPPAAKALEQVDRTKLRQVLADYFNEEELRDLCFELGIDYENLAGSTKSGKARELVAYCERHMRIGELAAACYRLRPQAPW